MGSFRTYPYRKLAKPLLFRLSPDTAHEYTMKMSHLFGRIPGLASLSKAVFVRRHKMLESTWDGLHFSSPLGLSAGIDKNGQMVTLSHVVGFGFSTVGSVTSEPCAGNPRPWFYRLPKTQSIVVHAGLPNIGVHSVLARVHNISKRVQGTFPVVLSVARTNSKDASGIKEGIDDYVASIRTAKDSPVVRIIELNISCPNAYGGESYTTPDLLEELLSAVEAVKAPQPILVKMPVDLEWPAFDALLKVISKHDVAGVTIANLTKQRAKATLKEPLSDDIKGGLSGAPVRDLSTALIRRTYETYGDRLTIFGVGGVFTAEDAYEKICNGARYVELATGLILYGPGVVEEINSGLQKLLRRDGFTHVSQAVGSAVA